ncbi:MAG: OmpA family protein [Tunicatimonas sp.]|uniref:OmpA family protein n=1 Tax=Tunicatimonas sp. TaxID=1940096 RepID=UPI003C742B68
MVQNPERSGDQYFLAEQYFRAAQFYQLALKRDSSNHELAIKLAHSERYQFNYAKAAKWYQYAQNSSSDFSAKVAYYQSLMLKNIGRCNEAYRWLDSLLVSSQLEARNLHLEAKQLKLSCQEIDLTSRNIESIVVSSLDSTVNSQNYDYAPIIMNGDSVLILTSTRFAGKQKISYRFGENNANFFSYRRQGNQFIDTSTFVSAVNTKSSEGAGCYVESRKEFYFTYCANDQPCKIYFVASNGLEWSKPASLPESINQENTESKHPSVSASGDTLFFTSNRAGGQGGSDIWMSIRTSENQWLSPVCLDSLVNSTSDEVTPYYHSQEDQLYFSSDNRRGFGGMDLYVISDFSSANKRARGRLPLPINSSADDSYLVLGQQLGYLASNRNGNFDIYRFKKTKDQPWFQFLLEIPSLPSDPKGDLLTTISTNRIRRVDYLNLELNDWIWVNAAQQKRLSSGATRFILNSDVSDIQMKQYQQKQNEEAVAQNVEVVSTIVSPDADSTLTLTSFSTDSSEAELISIVTGQVSITTTRQPFAEQVIELRGNNGELLKTSTTNDAGEFRFVNLPANSEYSISLASAESQDTIDVSNLSLQTEPESAFSQTFEPVYFDFNQHKLRPESIKVLDALATFYQTNPEASIEINAFTDSLGNDVYNVLLSRKRGEAAFDYLINLGVDRSALAINANGVSTSYTSTNAYVSQQLNRRVEFEIFGLQTPFSYKATTKILRPNVDLSQLLESTLMTWEELAQLNGRPLNTLEPYKPIRVYKNEITEGNSLFYQIIDIN